jgi:acyl carrier protein
MKHNLIEIFKKVFPKKKIKISITSDLLRDNILDSLELINFIAALEKNYKFNTKKYFKKNKDFVIKSIQKSINS